MGDDEASAKVDFVVISGNTETDEQIDDLMLTVRHAIMVQFGGRGIVVTIEEKKCVDEHPENGVSYS